MIPTVREPEEYYQQTRVYEKCYFGCGNSTDRWHWRTNQPICTSCAKTRKVAEIEKCLGYKPLTKKQYKNQ